MSYDVIIIGLGGMGSAAAHACAHSGYSVLGLERFGPAHNLGSSHGETRVIRQAYFESPDYVPLILHSYALWRRLERETGKKLLHTTGGIFMSPPGLEVFSGSLSSVRLHDLSHEVLDAGEIAKRWPVLRPSPHFRGLFENEAGVLPVEECVQTMLDLATDKGAELRFHQKVTDWEVNEKGVTVYLEDGRVQGSRLIICPGAWVTRVMKHSMPLTVQRMVLHWFKPHCDIGVFDSKRLPVYFFQIDEKTDFYGFPVMDYQQGVKVAFHSFREPCQPDTVDRTVTQQEVNHMASFLKTFMPDLNGEHVKSAVCMYTSTPDGHFVLGPHPSSSRVTMVCGFSGHGFKFAPLIGEIARDLAFAGGSDHPISLFDPMRFEV